MRITHGIRQITAALALVLCTTLGADQSLAANTGTFSHLSPTSAILVISHPPNTRLTFVKFGTNKVLGTYDPGGKAEGLTFSLSERFVCIDADTVPYNSVVVLDLARHLRPVLKIVGSSNLYAYCTSSEGIRFRNGALPIDSLANNLVMIRETRQSGPGNCLQKGTTKFWELRTKTPKVIKQFSSFNNSCP